MRDWDDGHGALFCGFVKDSFPVRVLQHPFCGLNRCVDRLVHLGALLLSQPVLSPLNLSTLSGLTVNVIYQWIS